MTEEPNKPFYKKKFLYLDKFTDHLTEDQKWKKKIESDLIQMDIQLMLFGLVLAAMVVGNIIMWVLSK